jgi:putative hydrolase of the HAD superfamily
MSGGPRALLVDYGGVLTNPLLETVSRYAELSGLSLTDLAMAQTRVGDVLGVPPMAALEIALITEARFLELMSEALRRLTGRTMDAARFHEQWFAGRRPNREFLDYLGALGGPRLAMVTNNVREWRPFWQANVPAGLFDVVVDSSVEGVRKPDRRFFEIALRRVGCAPEECVLVDDTEENCVAAAALGIRAIRFVDTAAAIAEIDKELAR